MTKIYPRQQPYGVLSLLYSVVLTRTVEQVQEDQGLEAESLIAMPFGHAKCVIEKRQALGLYTPPPQAKLW